MGALISSLFNFSQPLDRCSDVTPINFRDIEPSEIERVDYEKLAEIFSSARADLMTIFKYDGCSRSVQEAISHPNSEVENRAWHTIIPQIVLLDSYYTASVKIMGVFEEVTMKLCSGSVSENINSMNATTKLFADILYLAYEFDQTKVSKSQLQNDFSYYKRVLTRMKSSPVANELHLMPDARANNVSLFLAQFCPLTNSIVKSCTQMIARDKSDSLRYRVLELLPRISSMCSNIIMKNTSDELSVYCLKVIANVIVLCDHTDPVTGAFARGSKLNINSLIKLIQSHERPDTRNIFDFISRASLTFNNPMTPKNIKALIKLDRSVPAKDQGELEIQGPF